jgi:hypothetical protein
MLFLRSASDEKKEILTVKPTKVSYDGGKTWIDLTKKEEKHAYFDRLSDIS